MPGQARILIVDDDATFAESIRDLLEASGYEVLLAADGQQGLATALVQRPDLMVLDVMMSSPTEGLDVARRVREHPELSAMKVLLVTGVSQVMRLPRPPEPDSTWLPVDQVLEKPIAPQRLLREIERLLLSRTAAPQTPEPGPTP